ncbi:MAG: flagellar protein FliT [Gammaproteobacteria bacterium]
MTEAIIKDARATLNVNSPMESMARIFRLTEKMLQAAKSGEWEMLANLQQEREQLLQGTVNLAEIPMAPKLMLSTLRKVLLLNKEIVSISEAECRHRQTQLEALHCNRRAANCYKREARGM